MFIEKPLATEELHSGIKDTIIIKKIRLSVDPKENINISVLSQIKTIFKTASKVAVLKYILA